MSIICLEKTGVAIKPLSTNQIDKNCVENDDGKHGLALPNLPYAHDERYLCTVPRWQRELYGLQCCSTCLCVAQDVIAVQTFVPLRIACGKHGDAPVVCEFAAGKSFRSARFSIKYLLPFL